MLCWYLTPSLLLHLSRLCQVKDLNCTKLISQLTALLFLSSCTLSLSKPISLRRTDTKSLLTLYLVLFCRVTVLAHISLSVWKYFTDMLCYTVSFKHVFWYFQPPLPCSFVEKIAIERDIMSPSPLSPSSPPQSDLRPISTSDEFFCCCGPFSNVLLSTSVRRNCGRPRILDMYWFN